MTPDFESEPRKPNSGNELGGDELAPTATDGNELPTSQPSQSTDEDDVLTECLECFAPHAPVANPGELVEYLPTQTAVSKTLVLIELIKLDMAAAAEDGSVPKIERYVQAMPDLLSVDSVPILLVMEEIQLRKESNENPNHEEYAKRFPQHASVLAPMLGVAEASSGMKPTQLDIGITIDDFLIIQTLGAGAFANVYLARQISMQRLVALKASKGTGGESQALAQFDHANIVRVYDQRNVQNPNVHLLYMQYVPGGTLSDVVKLARNHDLGSRNGRLLLDAVDRQLLRAAQVVPERSSVRNWLEKAEWATVVAWIGVQLARALDDAHRNDVFHRDVKPANVLLTAEGIPKLADFNVSFSEAAGRAGAVATFGGSMPYMSLEHLQAIHPDFARSPDDVRETSDLCSLAILLWELWQGERPFDRGPKPKNQSESLDGQLAGRSMPLIEPQRTGSGSERVLESTLRSALQPNPADRPSSGAELAGRLKLALHPEAAGLFNPDENSFRSWLLRRSVWIVAGLAIMLPNIAVGYFNYYYNHEAMERLDADQALGIESFLNKIAWRFNAVVFPFGFLIALWRILPVARALKSVQQGGLPTDHDLRATLSLSQHVALIGGGFWMAAGVFYSSVISYNFEVFQTAEGVHFFISLMICGGIAATYPYFGTALLGSLVYYPRLLREVMQDRHFDERSDLLIARSESWLLAGAGIPLLGAALLIFHNDDSKTYLLTLVVLTAAGLIASFWAYRYLLRYWTQMATVLSARGSSVVPGTYDDD